MLLNFTGYSDEENYTYTTTVDSSGYWSVMHGHYLQGGEYFDAVQREQGKTFSNPVTAPIYYY